MENQQLSLYDVPPDLLPGFVYGSTCECRHTECPFNKTKETENGQVYKNG